MSTEEIEKSFSAGGADINIDPRSAKMAIERVTENARTGITEIASTDKIGPKIAKGVSRCLMIHHDLGLLDIRSPNLEWMKFKSDRYYVDIARELTCKENYEVHLPFKLKSPEARDFLSDLYEYFSLAYDQARNMSVNLYTPLGYDHKETS